MQVMLHCRDIALPKTISIRLLAFEDHRILWVMGMESPDNRHLADDSCSWSDR
jgi:hypothetical protein